MHAVSEKLLQTLGYGSIRDILRRYCDSALGKELTGKLVPLDSLTKVRRAMDQVSEMKTFLATGGLVSFRGASDAVGIIEGAREKNKTIEPGDLYAVASLLECAGRIKSTFLDVDDDMPELKALSAKILDLDDLETEILRTVDSRGKVLSSASTRLTEIRGKLAQLTTAIRRKAESYLKNREVVRSLQDVNIVFRNGRMALPVRTECRKKIRGILHDYSASGNTAFIEPEELVEKQNQLETKKVQESREITRILWECTRKVIDLHEEIRTNQRIVAWMDFSRARARYSEEQNLMAPELTEDGVFNLRQARHPLLLDICFLEAEGKVEERCKAAHGGVVPIDLHLGDHFDVMVITGPNTGGKTVTLKTVGLLALMVASGLHLPVAQGTRFPMYEKILVDIGDEQDLAQSLSTFSSHIHRISRILEGASPRSLVLLDELGTGTDPLEGEALGRAILKFLVHSGAQVLVSTHLSRLKEFAFSTSRVENACVEFDPDTLRPTFRLSIGMPGESNAIRIARRLGIPRAILDDAEAALETKDTELKDLMDDVQRIRIQSEKTLGQAREDQVTMFQLKEKTEAHEKEIAFRRSVLAEEAEREIDECLRRARDRALALLPKLQNLPAPYIEHVDALKETLDRIVERSPLGVKRRQFVESLKKGDRVYLPRYREKCQVIKIYKKEDRVEVAYRGLSMKVPAHEIMWPHWF